MNITPSSKVRYQALAALLSALLIVQCQSPSKRDSESVPLSRLLATEGGPRSGTVEAVGTQYAVSTQGKYATLAAQEIFAQGGNIIDATTAASFAIAVERPQSTGIGGGGFMLYHEAQSGQTYAIDFRERAPLKASQNMFLDDKGQPIAERSRNGLLASGTPGMIAGLVTIHKRFGRLPLKTVMAPAIRLAEQGFPMYERLRHATQVRRDVLREDPAARAIFLDPAGEPWPVGHVFVQKDLAHTLRLIADQGDKVFYRGEIGRKITQFFKQNHGLISSEDLRRYKVKWRKPLRGTFKDYQIESMPPPSAGGIHVLQFLNVLEKDDLNTSGFLSAKSIHLAAAALQSAFADRAHHIGDPEFVKVPTAGLIDKAYAQRRRHEIPADQARKADQIHPGVVQGEEHTETTHLSLMDRDGNAVSTTQTVNGYLGSAVVVPQTGILMNNEMDDFSAKKGSSNLFGAVGSEADRISPGKTPLSSMAPTLISQKGRVILAVGAPGGTRIISCVAQTILNRLEFALPLFESVAAVRYHHQWQPDVLVIDPPGPAPLVLNRLQQMGYSTELKPVGCYVMAVSREGTMLHAVADPRDIGTSGAQ